METKNVIFELRTKKGLSQEELCPLPLRSKPFPSNCFRIVKVQKISSGSLLM